MHMILSHAFLILAVLTLLGTIAAQDFLYAPLRNETISAGLTGPYHWFLDGSYVLLALTLWVGTAGHDLMRGVVIVTDIALLATAATDTFYHFVDGITNGKHSLWHSRFTTGTFAGTFVLEMIGNYSNTTLWALTAANAAVPAAIYYLTRRGDYAEKLGVLIIGVWLVTWAL